MRRRNWTPVEVAGALIALAMLLLFCGFVSCTAEPPPPVPAWPVTTSYPSATR